MPQPTKLYFDKVIIKNEKDVYGQTENGESILYNLKQISDEWFNKYTDMLSSENKATLFIDAGRFLCIVTASLNINKKSMTAMDLFDNEQGALAFSQGDPKQQEFMHIFYKIRKNYKKSQDPFKLVEGVAPNINK